MFRPSLALLIALTTPAMAAAQAQNCRMPTDFAMPRPEPVQPDQIRRTPVTNYLLAISWSPQHCLDSRGRDRDALQCGGGAGRFGFVLHGLWPETDSRDWPQYCRPATQVPRAVIARTLCTTPSPELIQHEWQRHGTCMARDPDRYFRAARILYASVRYPDMAQLARETTLDVWAFSRAFSAANPGLRANMFTVHTSRDGWLEEVRICLDRRFRRARCPQHVRGAPPTARIRIAAPAS
jgi:ribonuclease T2